jgi:gamma-glutamyltranspeptidase/glutathione hydrolase
MRWWCHPVLPRAIRPPSKQAFGHCVRAVRRGDAAAAATLTACVAESIFTGLGGGGFATYFDARTGHVTCLDFFCAAPGLDGDRLAGPMRPVAIRFGEVPIPYEIGGPSVAVPGVVAGCGEIHARWGRLAWEDVVDPSVRVATTGVIMPSAHADSLSALVEAMLLDQGGPIYAPDGRVLAGGDKLHHPGLADALALIAEEGPEVFYTGVLGRLLVESVRSDGGALGPADLAAYRVREREVMSARLDDTVVFGRDDLNQTVATIRTLPPLGGMTPAERAVCLAKVLGGPDGLGDTTNITAVDADGNACVVTTTLGLGAGRWLPGYGVHLNSMLGEGELIKGSLAPGDRIASMMCPLIALDTKGRLVLALGSAGASRIRSALIQTLTGVFVEGMTVTQAVRKPRLHPVDDVVHLEPDYPAAEAEALAQAGFRVNRWKFTNHYFGGVSAVGTSGASGDPRRAGTAELLTVA